MVKVIMETGARCFGTQERTVAEMMGHSLRLLCPASRLIFQFQPDQGGYGEQVGLAHRKTNGRGHCRANKRGRTGKAWHPGSVSFLVLDLRSLPKTQGGRGGWGVQTCYRRRNKVYYTSLALFASVPSFSLSSTHCDLPTSTTAFRNRLVPFECSTGNGTKAW